MNTYDVRQLSEILPGIVGQFSFPLLSLYEVENPEQGHIIGSSVSITQNGRRFLATNRHVVIDVERLAQIGESTYFARNSYPKQETVGLEKLKIKGVFRHETADLAYLEIGNDLPGYSADDFYDFLEIGNLSQADFFLFGYPRSASEKDFELRTRRLEITCKIYGIPVPVSYLDFAANSNYGENCELYYSPIIHMDYSQDRRNSLMLGYESKYAFDKSPRGFSGCGVWGIASNGDLFTPKDVRLIGIQSYFNSSEQKLLVIPINEVRSIIV